MIYSCNHKVGVTRYHYSRNIPQELSGFKILQLSDIHGDIVAGKLEGILEVIRAEAPDLTVVTGDVIDNIHIQNAARVLEFLMCVNSEYEMFLVSGNHEYMHRECFDVYQKIEQSGISVLHNETRRVTYNGVDIALTGVEDPYALYHGEIPEKYTTPGEKFRELMRQCFGEGKVVKSGDFRILLSHRPEFMELYSELGFDIVFSGHAHGGQFRLPFLGGVIAPDQGLFPKYDAGVYLHRETTMYVSRGLGNSVVPVRLFNRPEIVVVEF